MSKSILYNFWGYLSDKIGISSPDGNATYSPFIIDIFNKTGYKVYAGPIDRDKTSIDVHGYEKAFGGFMTQFRTDIHKSLTFVNMDNLPDVDILLLEWRFPTTINQLPKDDPNFSPDLVIQHKLLEHYRNTRTRIVVMDLDYNLTEDDLKKYRIDKVLEQGSSPKLGTYCPLPVNWQELIHYRNTITRGETIRTHKKAFMAYIGNDYKRRDDIHKKITPLSDFFVIDFYGKWLTDEPSQVEFRTMNPNIRYNGRVGAGDFTKIYSSALCVPLLAPKEYREHGFMTYRIIEVLMFGSLPIGFDDFKNINNFLPEELIFCDDAKCNNHLINNLLFGNTEYLFYKCVQKLEEVFSQTRFFNEVVK